MDIFNTALIILTNFCVASCKVHVEVDEIHGYHFHVYFFEKVANSLNEALTFRSAIESQIKSGFLKDCIVKPVNQGPYGPHQVGNYETCCNKTGLSRAMSFFMLNHGNLSVLFHPLTRYEKKDHSGREMFLGPRIPIRIDDLAEDLLDYKDLCNSIDQVGKVYKNGQSSRVNAKKVPQY